jgi:hypothetical protein
MSKTKEEIDVDREARALLKSKIENDVVATDKLITEARVLQHVKDFHASLLKYETALRTGSINLTCERFIE